MSDQPPRGHDTYRPPVLGELPEVVEKDKPFMLGSGQLTQYLPRLIPPYWTVEDARDRVQFETRRTSDGKALLEVNIIAPTMSAQMALPLTDPEPLPDEQQLHEQRLRSLPGAQLVRTFDALGHLARDAREDGGFWYTPEKLTEIFGIGTGPHELRRINRYVGVWETFKLMELTDTGTTLTHPTLTRILGKDGRPLERPIRTFRRGRPRREYRLAFNKALWEKEIRKFYVPLLETGRKLMHLAGAPLYLGRTVIVKAFMDHRFYVRWPSIEYLAFRSGLTLPQVRAAALVVEEKLGITTNASGRGGQVVTRLPRQGFMRPMRLMRRPKDKIHLLPGPSKK